MSKLLSAESAGETLEAAIQAGLAELGVERTNVKIDVIEEGSRGVLGLGQKDAKVRLTVLDEEKAVEVEEEPEPEPEPVAEVEEAVEEDSAEDEEENDEAEPAPPAPVKASSNGNGDDEHPSLEQAVEVSGHFVSTLLEMMGIEASVEVIVSEIDDFGEQIPVVKVVGDDLKILIGHRGKVLNDFQFLARSMASQKLEGRTTFVVDVDGYREKRTDTLVELARRTADKVVKARRPVALNPMPPHERRVIHMALRNDNRVSTSSKGEGKRRRVRVVPKRGG